MTIRLLTPEFSQAYKELRLKALQTNPESFLAEHETEKRKSLDSFSWELRYAASPPVSGYYGVFAGEDDEKLVGYALLDQVALDKQQHIAYLYNLYIDPDHRGKGYATALFEQLATLAKKAAIERIFITCNRKNAGAQLLYKKLGFKQYSIREKSVKWRGEYDDEVEMVREL
jgi:ribosomal protein S18 acetylase RimI-like enzyme